jgi:hypothetical protein
MDRGEHYAIEYTHAILLAHPRLRESMASIGVEQALIHQVLLRLAAD